MKYTLNNREVEILDLHLEIGEGVWVHDARYIDDNTPLTDAELDDLADKYASELYENAYSSLGDAAEYYMEDR